MLSHSLSFPYRDDSRDHILEDYVSDTDGEVEDSGKVIYIASFEELVTNQMHYDTIIWLVISLLLVLAWGIGLLMLLYLPVRRYVLHKELLSRQLHVTEDNIVYKARRPFFLPFMGSSNIEKTVPLYLVLDITIEQGWLQSLYGLCTFKIESIAYGQAALVDAVQFQGVSNPELLRKVIITAAAKYIRDAETWKLLNTRPSSERYGASTPRVLMEAPSSSKFYYPVKKTPLRSRHVPGNSTVGFPDNALLHKLEEISHSVNMLEPLVMGLRLQSQGLIDGSNSV